MPNRRQVVAAALPLVLASRRVAAQSTVIEKPARMLVGFPPGGAADLTARLFVGRMKGYAPSLVVENKPGAGGRIGLEAAKNAPADGSTLILTPSSMVVIYPHVFKALAYDPLADLIPVAPVCKITLGVFAGPKVPASVRTLADLLAWFKANPTEASLGYTAQGSTQHFTTILLERAGGVAFTGVPYKGGGLAVQDVLGGQIAATVTVPSTALPHVTAGKLRALATTGAARDAGYPTTPTFTEAGFKDIVVEEWFGVFLPARTPPAIVTRLNASLAEAAATSEVREGLARASLLPAMSDPETFARLVRADHDKWGAIVRAVGYKAEEQ